MYVDTPPPAYIADLPSYVVPQAVFLATSIAYLIGSFPEGVMFIVLRLVKRDVIKGNPRNPEAGELYKAGHKIIAGITLAIEMLKGPCAMIASITIGAIFIKDNLNLPEGVHVCIPQLPVYMLFLPALGALLGHLYPVWTNFKGGKGIGSAIGLLIFLNPVVGLIAGAAWLEVQYFSRRNTLATLVAMTVAPVLGMMFANVVWLEKPHVSLHFAYIAFVMALLVMYKHKNDFHVPKSSSVERAMA